MPSSYTIGKHYEGFVAELVRSGRYASASEVMRDSLRLLEQQEAERQLKLEALREDIRLAKAGGEPAPVEEVFARLRQRYTAG